MAMEITNSYSSYAASYTDITKKSDSKATTELKTNTSTDSKEKVQAYYEKLCKKFPQIKINTSGGITSASRNNIVLNLSKDCLKKMASDPDFAKKIENDIAGIPAAQEQMFARAKSDGIEIQGFAVKINEDGSMQCTCSGSTRTSGTKQNSSILNTEKRQKERIEKRREERKILEEKAAKRRAEKRAEKKSIYGSRREYSDYLNSKYPCLTPTKDSSVSINPNLLSKAASDPKTAKWLENTLSQMPDCINKICENSAKNGAMLISLEISIDSEDCITTKCVGVFESDPGTEESKKMLEEAIARNKERKEEWEKLLEKNKEKKADQEKLAEKKAEQKTAENRNYDITVMGTDMGKVTENLMSKMSMGSSGISTIPAVAGFDIKA